MNKNKKVVENIYAAQRLILITSVNIILTARCESPSILFQMGTSFLRVKLPSAPQLGPSTDFTRIG